MGRPSSYTPETGAEICRLIEEGGTIRSICGQDGFPDWTTVRRWLRDNEDFRTQYAHAREVSADALEMELMETAESAVDRDSAAAARVKVDALKWIMSKRAPKVYGDKVTQEHTGPDGGPVVFKWQD